MWVRLIHKRWYVIKNIFSKLSLALLITGYLPSDHSFAQSADDAGGSANAGTGTKAEEYFKKAADLEKKGDCPAAVKYYKGIAKTESFGEIAALGLARCHLENQQSPEAEAALVWFLKERNPFSFEVQKALVMMLVNQSRFEDASKELNVALRLRSEDNRLQGLRAMLLNKQGRNSEALGILDRLVSIDPNNFDWRLLRADIFFDQKNYIRSASDYEVLNQKTTTVDTNIRRNLTICYMEMQNWKAAVATARTLTDARPTDAKAWETLGDALSKSGDASGKQAYEKALSLRSNNTELRFKLVGLFMNDKQWDDAITHLKRIVEQNKEGSKAGKMIVGIYKQLNRRDDLGVFLKKYLDTRQDEAWAAIEYIKVLDAIGRTEFAAELIGTALSADSKDRGVRNAIALIQYKTGKFEDAKRSLAVLQQEKPSAVVAFNMAVILEQQGKLDDAMRFYQSINKDHALSSKAEFNRALCLERAGNKQGAIVVLAAIPEQATNIDKVRRKLSSLSDAKDSANAMAAKSLEDLLPYRTWEYEQ